MVGGTNPDWGRDGSRTGVPHTNATHECYPHGYTDTATSKLPWQETRLPRLLRTSVSLHVVHVAFPVATRVHILLIREFRFFHSCGAFFMELTLEYSCANLRVAS